MTERRDEMPRLLPVLIFSIFVSSIAASEGDIPERDDRVLDSFPSFKQFINSDSDKQRKFRLRGRVIYARGGFIRMQFGDAIKSFQMPESESLTEVRVATSELMPGDLLEVGGVAGKHSPFRLNDFKLIAPGSVKDLEPEALFRNGEPVFWRYVEHIGTVRALYDEEGTTELLLKDGAKELVVKSYKKMAHDDIAQLLGAKVRVWGASSKSKCHPNGKGRRLTINVMDWNSQLRVEKQPRGKEVGEPKCPGCTRAFRTTVDSVGPGILIAGGFRIEREVGNDLEIDDELTLIVSDCDLVRRTSRARAIIVTGKANRSHPPLLSASQVVEGKNVFQRLTVQGLVEQSFFHNNELELVLRGDDKKFRVTMPLTKNVNQVSQFEVGSLLRVSGLVLGIEPNAVEAFSIDTRGMHDIRIENRPLRLQANQINWILLAASVVASCVVLGQWRLRRKIRRKSEEVNSLYNRLAAASRAVQDGILVFNEQAKITFTNNNLGRIFGFEIPNDWTASEVEKAVSALFEDEEQFARVWNQAFGDSSSVHSEEYLLKDGRWVWVYTAPVQNKRDCPEGRIWKFDDITARKCLEEETLQTRKINAVGRLAGGIAHDFNNLLQVIRCNLSLIELDANKNKQPELMVNDGTDGYSPTEAASIAVARAAELTRQLLTFSKRSAIETKPTDVNAIVQQSVSLLERTLGGHVSLRISLDSEIPHARVDAGQIQQIVVNMCLNSRDAIGVSGGYIRIRTHAGDAKLPGPSIVLSIEDNGCGMSADLVEKIFDPFFTTKPLDKGTGLGLSTALGAIEQMGGRIECDSREGEGTRFDIILPACHELRRTSTQHSVGNLTFRSSQQRFLLVDDDLEVVRGMSALFSQLGHSVESANGGEEALALLDVDQAFDAVFLDLSMPGMTGRETLQHIRAKHPGLKVVVCSGYSDEASSMLDSSVKPDAFLSKPVDLTKLTEIMEPIEKKCA